MLLCVSVLGFFLALLSLDHELLSFGLMLVETFAGTNDWNRRCSRLFHDGLRSTPT